MTEEGFLTCKEKAQEGRPGKKIYSITSEGRNALTQALGTTRVTDVFKSEYLFLSLLSDLMPERDIYRFYEERLDYLRNELKEIEDVLASSDHSGSRFVAGYGKAVVKAGLTYLEENNPVSSSPPKQAAE